MVLSVFDLNKYCQKDSIGASVDVHFRLLDAERTPRKFGKIEYANGVINRCQQPICRLGTKTPTPATKEFYTNCATVPCLQKQSIKQIISIMKEKE